MNKFLSSVTSNDLIRSSQLYKDFISLNQDDFDAIKGDYDQLTEPKDMKDFISLEGVLDVRISDEVDSKVIDIQRDVFNKNNLYKALNDSLNNLMYEFDIISAKFKEVSLAFKNLSNAYKTSINGSYIEKAFSSLASITGDWSKAYSSQKSFFKIEIKEFFKYIHKEINSFTNLYDDYSITRTNFVEFKNKLSKVKDNPQKFNEMKKEYFGVKVCFGFILNRLYYEYIRVNQEHADRIRKQFTMLNENKDTFLSDYLNLTNMLNMNI